MERLTFTDKEIDAIREYAPDFDCPVKAEEGDIVNKFCDTICDEFQSNCPFMKMGQKLKKYEDAEEKRLLLKLPCKVGTTVYCIENECEDMYIEGSDYLFVAEEKFDYWMLEHFGKEVFLTQEEAEQALAELNKKTER